jgi:hypothetical protein
VQENSERGWTALCPARRDHGSMATRLSCAFTG